MARSYRGRFLGVLAANEQRMTAAFTDLATAIAGEITRRADADGKLPRNVLPELQAAVGQRVTNFFVSRGRDGKPAPFETLPDGKVFPLSPYMRALWAAIGEAMRIPVEQQAGMLAKRLPADVERRWRMATADPFAAAKVAVKEQIFRPNPLAQYDPPHRWVDPNGYTLSERVWNVTGDTRRRLDAFLEDAIRTGRGARAISQQLEQFLVPGRALLRTKAPYGSDASYDAMRIARTEISRAHAQAAQISAAMNPFVQGLKWNLSGSHPKPDICDDNARGGENGDGVYPIDGFPTMPAHPNCLCHATYQMIPAANQEEILGHLHDDVQAKRAELVDLIGPLLVEQFLNLLLREGLGIDRGLPEVQGSIFTPARVMA